jgi:two-component system, chemotaxis family, protein-glutamate methylesterase/glutaminase
MSAAEQKVIKVLIVEDSPTVAEFLTHVLEADPRIQVIGTAFDCQLALEAIQRTKPEVIAMEINMPQLNGFQVTRRIMEMCPTPIVIFGGSNADEVRTNFQAIEAGALAVVARPSGMGHPDHEATAKEFVETVKMMSEVKVVRRWPQKSRVPVVFHKGPVLPVPPKGACAQAIAIGASTGGPLVLQTILRGLPQNLPAPILIVQHISPGFVHGFVEWLSSSSGFNVRVPTDGEYLNPGQAYVAPDNLHMGVRACNRIYLTKDGRENGMRPSVSFLFRSVKDVFGSGTVGVLLTGMGRDGVEELKRLRDAGAMTIAQDEETCVVRGMPTQAIKAGAATLVLPPDGIANMLAAIVTKS